jgi:hypothetical protein
MKNDKNAMSDCIRSILLSDGFWKIGELQSKQKVKKILKNEIPIKRCKRKWIDDVVDFSIGFSKVRKDDTHYAKGHFIASNKLKRLMEKSGLSWKDIKK